MLASPCAYRTAIGSVVFLVIICFFAFRFPAYNPLFDYPGSHSHIAHQLDRDEFLGQWLNATGGASSDESAVYNLCYQSHIQWRPQLVLRLEDARGGISQVRNNLLDFLHYAIQAGAAIVLPSYKTKAQEVSVSSIRESSFEGFFDKDYFLATMKARCPQMVIYNDAKDKRLPSPIGSRFTPGNEQMRSDLHSDQTPAWGVTQLDNWLSEHDAIPKAGEIKMVNVEQSLYSVDTRALPEKVRVDFSGLLRLRPEARRLAGIIVYNMALRHDLRINAERAYARNAFLAAHLFTGNEAEQAGWPDGTAYSDYESQSSVYLKQAKQLGLSIIYCASDSLDDLHKLTVEARDHHNITVTHKADLLDSIDLFDLRQMTWDQQAAVDYEVMTRASHFAGVVKSGFGFNLALRRNVFVEQEGRNLEKHWYMPADVDRNRTYEDGLSTLWGVDEELTARALRGMWP